MLFTNSNPLHYHHHRALRVTDNSTLIPNGTAIVAAQLLVSYLFRYKVFKVFNDISDELFDSALLFRF